jgi:hypothetical protein
LVRDPLISEMRWGDLRLINDLDISWYGVYPSTGGLDSWRYMEYSAFSNQTPTRLGRDVQRQDNHTLLDVRMFAYVQEN